MTAEDLSAYGSIAAAAIAFVALIVAIYAAVVARSGARSAKQQADIALRGYRVQAALEVGFNLRVFESVGPFAANEEPASAFWSVYVQRTGGPPELCWRGSAKGTVENSSGHLEMAEKESSWAPYDNQYGASIHESTSVAAPDFASIKISVEFAEANDPAAITDDTPRWTFKRNLVWSGLEASPSE